MPTEDQMAREVAKRELAMQEKQSSKKRRCEVPKKVKRQKGKYISKKVRKKNATVERVVEKKN